MMENGNEAGTPLSQIDTIKLKNYISDFIDDAEFVMANKLDADYKMKLISWVFKYSNERFSYLPLMHLRAAIKYGSLGQRQGTQKLMPRNISIWLNEQNNIFQEQMAQMQRKKDEERRAKEMTDYKPSDGFVAASVRIKVFWLADKLITGDEYSSFSSKAIYDLLKSGVPEKQIHPRDIIPDYDLKRQK